MEFIRKTMKSSNLSIQMIYFVLKNQLIDITIKTFEYIVSCD